MGNRGGSERKGGLGKKPKALGLGESVKTGPGHQRTWNWNPGQNPNYYHSQNPTYYYQNPGPQWGQGGQQQAWQQPGKNKGAGKGYVAFGDSSWEQYN